LCHRQVRPVRTSRGRPAKTLIASVVVIAFGEEFSMPGGAWTYGVVKAVPAGSGVGLGALAQWLIITLLPYTAAWSVIPVCRLDLPMVGITTSSFMPDNLPHRNWRAP
jgi:hypothetical protein